MKAEIKYVPISLVDYNEGQLDGVPANPRTRDDSRQAKLAESIEELPEMSEARPPLVFPYNGRYIVIGGNRRLEAFRDLNREEIPVVIPPKKRVWINYAVSSCWITRVLARPIGRL